MSDPKEAVEWGENIAHGGMIASDVAKGLYALGKTGSLIQKITSGVEGAPELGEGAMALGEFGAAGIGALVLAICLEDNNPEPTLCAPELPSGYCPSNADHSDPSMPDPAAMNADSQAPHDVASGADGGSSGAQGYCPSDHSDPSMPDPAAMNADNSESGGVSQDPSQAPHDTSGADGGSGGVSHDPSQAPHDASGADGGSGGVSQDPSQVPHDASGAESGSGMSQDPSQVPHDMCHVDASDFGGHS